MKWYYFNKLASHLQPGEVLEHLCHPLGIPRLVLKVEFQGQVEFHFLHQPTELKVGEDFLHRRHQKLR